METSDSNFTVIKQGAEAKLYLGSFLGRRTIVKERFKKSYRHPELDDRLTKERMRAELRGLVRSTSAGISTPSVYFVHNATNSIYLEYIENTKTVNEYITLVLKTVPDDSEVLSRLRGTAEQIGKILATMHLSDIIHGDLTTSNILIVPNCSWDEISASTSFNVYLIDFGLSHVDSSAEDKGVDLYVLERALTSTHSKLTWFFEAILREYMATYMEGGREVFDKLEEVRLRGRKRTMVG